MLNALRINASMDLAEIAYEDAVMGLQEDFYHFIRMYMASLTEENETAALLAHMAE